MARLILTTAEGTQAVELRAVNSLGRHPNNTIQLLDKIVSKEHCIIEHRGDHYVLRDLGSLNGTFVNNERVRGESLLRHGDEIALGATRGRFEDPQATAPPRPVYPQATPQMHGQMHGAPPQHGAPSQMAQQPGAQHPQSGAARPAGAPMPGASPLAQSGAIPYSAQQYPPGYPQPGQHPGGSIPPPTHAPSTAAPSHGHPGYPQAHPQHPGTAPLPSPRQVVAGAPPGYAPPGQPAPAPGFGTGPLGTLGVRGGLTGFVPFQPPQAQGVAINDQERQIGTQIDAVEKGFVPFERVANDVNQLRADYERLRLSHELSHAIGIERDTQKLLDKVLTSILKFISADRAVIFLRSETDELQLAASKRRDGSNAPITVSTTILNHVVKERAAVLTHDAAMDFAASKGKSMILNRISSAIVAPLLQHDNEILGVLWLDSETLARFQAKDLELVQTITNQAARFIEINILGKKVEAEIISRERLSRLLSPNIAERVISGQLEVKPGGQRVEECTVFNSDIRGFTRMSESSTPEILVEMLNNYFEIMVDTIFKYEGTLDKFMGDGIMALWGAPVQVPDDAIHSVDCALEMAEVLGEFNRARMAQELAPLAVGIGIHTGPLVAGYIGSSKALSYTVIGDTANTSARLCSHAAAGQIIVSENTLVRLRNRFEVEELPSAKVKGKEKPLRIYNVLRRAKAVAVPGNPFAAEPTTALGQASS